MAERLNMPGIASSATAVLAGHIGGGTSRIRVGSGDFMLSNHAPLRVADLGYAGRTIRAALTSAWTTRPEPTH